LKVDRHIAKRFWSRVDKSAGRNKCWIWMGGFTEKGYGRFRFNGRMDKAHRVSVILSGRRVRPGEPVLHECDTPACVNPKHLRSGTWLENVREMQARGKARGGIMKLSPQAVATIRASRGKQKDLAVEFGVNQSCISHVKTGRRWKGK
jgi:hypothetical protein